MQTPIGQSLRSSPKLAAAGFIGCLAVAIDLWLIGWRHYPASIEGRFTVALLGLAAYIYLMQGDLASLGLIVRPIQGWRYWFRASLLIGMAVAGCIVAGFGVWLLMGQELPRFRTLPPEFAAEAFLGVCVFAPVVEETIYRFLLCIPLAAWGRPRLAIAASGLAFAGLHLVYGNPSPENLVGGFFLAWAYLKSGTIVIPLLLHAAGNAVAVLTWIAGWYLLGDVMIP